jgi:hypothetical protein
MEHGYGTENAVVIGTAMRIMKLVEDAVRDGADPAAIRADVEAALAEFEQCWPSLAQTWPTLRSRVAANAEQLMVEEVAAR